MKVAREGLPFIAIAVVVLIAFGGLGWWIPFALWTPITLWVIAFFRDPPRDRVRGAELILSPADGVVVSVIAIDEPTFVQGPTTRVAIFMNVLNVHVNRYPVDGTIAHRVYSPGKFLHAGTDKASSDNEQSSIGLATARGKVLVRQIAGSIARRIVTDHQEGFVARQGDRMGLIRFGSRVDLFLPPNTTLRVKPGDRTKAGETVVATWTT